MIQRIDQSQREILAAIESSSRTNNTPRVEPVEQSINQSGLVALPSSNQNLPPIPHDLRSAQTFVPTLDDLDQFSAASKRGYGCEAVLKWTRSKGRAIVERLGNQWWKDLSIEPSIRDNVLGKRWKRIQSVMDLMGGTQATPQIAKAMDTTRNIRYPDMKLSTWLELTISAHTTISTAQKYQDFIRGACGPERDADWTREAGAVLTLLDTIIGTASDPFQFTTKQGRTKLDAMVNLNEVEPRARKLLQGGGQPSNNVGARRQRAVLRNSGGSGGIGGGEGPPPLPLHVHTRARV